VIEPAGDNNGFVMVIVSPVHCAAETAGGVQ
jgi:hypothetical protein